jgi:hypothetical protein
MDEPELRPRGGIVVPVGRLSNESVDRRRRTKELLGVGLVVAMLAGASGLVSWTGRSSAPVATPEGIVQAQVDDQATSSSETATRAQNGVPAVVRCPSLAASTEVPAGVAMRLRTGRLVVGANVSPDAAPLTDRAWWVPFVALPLQSTIELLTLGDRCAIGWRIELGGRVVDQFVNTDRDPAAPGKVRFRVPFTGSFSGTPFLTAQFQFAGGWATTAWRILPTPPLPARLPNRFDE